MPGGGGFGGFVLALFLAIVSTFLKRPSRKE